jgi:hypothetical protein
MNPTPAPPTDERIEPTAAQVVALLERAHALARRAVDAGHHPFGALLVAPDHETVLLEQGNVDSVNHAENPTLDLPCRHVFARGQKDVRVIGPVAAMAEPIVAMHRRYWRSR